LTLQDLQDFSGLTGLADSPIDWLFLSILQNHVNPVKSCTPISRHFLSSQKNIRKKFGPIKKWQFIYSDFAGNLILSFENRTLAD
jgi:hypothetical protein